ncbi:MAG: rod shape-determining protein RodA [Chloroflexi bacterium]|nr:rod shape-determining protein RodA [Chloroflexota bacterium]MBI3339847.1 rod shape-determining protein RodA [Chloroflexota bacterium]
MRGLSWRNFDFLLLGAVVLASTFGVMMIRSAIAGNEGLLPLGNRQIYFVLIGLVVIVLLAGIDYRYWLSLHWPIYLIMMIFLLALSGLGQAAFGAQRWFTVGVLFLQPTEFAKIVVILVLARYFEKSQNDPRDLKWLIKSLAWVWGLVIWILLQPNLSNVIVTMVIWAGMVWMNGLQLKHVIIFGAVGALAFGALVALTISGIRLPFLQKYQQDRIVNFILPDPNATYGSKYNVDQALIAIGSGGLFGKGYGYGTQTQFRFLKVRHTDFIFSATAEEFGLAGAIIVIAMEAFIIWRCFRAAQKARDLSGAMIAFGVAMLLFFQGSANIAVNLRLIPVSGLPLPFISYGGSGLMSLMVGIGLVESVTMRHKSMDF